MINGKTKDEFAKDFLEKSGYFADLKLGGAEDQSPVYQMEADTISKLIDVLYWEDGDLDGVPDWRDELHGANDNVDKIYLPDGTIIAEVNDELWARFRPDGEPFEGFYSRSLSSMTSGGTSISGTLSPSGPSVTITYSGPQGTYTFTEIPPPADIIVEGSPY